MDLQALTGIDSMLLIFAVALIVMVGAVVQSGLGMGFGLTAAPLLALIDPSLVPAPTLMLGFVTATMGALREPAGIAWNEVMIGSVGRVAGTAIATALLAIVAGSSLFDLVFGLLVGCAVLLSLAGWRLAFNRASLTAMCFVSGLMGTITSVGAPPLAIVYQDRPAATARPTLAAFFAVGCAISLIGLHLAGWAGLRELSLAALMAPPMVAGSLLSVFLRGRFDRRYRPALLVLAGIASLMLIVRGLA